MNPTPLIFLFFWLASAVGWIANIAQLAMNMPETIANITPFQLLKIIGILVAPLGSVLGWLGFF